MKFGNRRSFITILIVAGILFLVGSGLMFCFNNYKKPENVFARMLANSLSTTSVTKRSVVAGEAQQVTQTTQLQTTPDPRIHGIVEISQGSGDQKSFVKRETITSTTANFVRLVQIETSQKNAAGQPYNFSSVLGAWGTTAATEGDNSISQLYGQNVAVPYANISAAQRRALLAQIQRDNVYQVDYSKVVRSTINGRQAYAYDVGVKPEAFISMMKAVGAAVGVKSFDEVDPASYENLPIVKFKFIVDVLSSDLIAVDYGNGQFETYSGVGVRSVARNPNSPVSMNELQQRLQNLQR